MNESVEIQLAKITIQMEMISSELVEAKERRRKQYKTQEELNYTLLSINNRLTAVEQSIAESAPTLREFVEYKHKVIGAGLMGKWLWAVGGVLIGSIAATRTFTLQLLGITPQ